MYKSISLLFDIISFNENYYIPFFIYYLPKSSQIYLHGIIIIQMQINISSIIFHIQNINSPIHYILNYLSYYSLVPTIFYIFTYLLYLSYLCIFLIFRSLTYLLLMFLYWIHERSNYEDIIWMNDPNLLNSSHLLLGFDLDPLYHNNHISVFHNFLNQPSLRKTP